MSAATEPGLRSKRGSPSGSLSRRPIAIGFSRDVVDPVLQDAGHLAAQELILRLLVRAGWRGRFEAASDPDAPRQSTDLELTAADGQVVLVEVWNRLDDLGAAVRSSDRKLADVGSRRGRNPSVRSCWLLVDTAANRELVRRHPMILRARFSGSSVGLVRALSTGSAAPTAPASPGSMSLPAAFANSDFPAHSPDRLRSQGAGALMKRSGRDRLPRGRR